MTTVDFYDKDQADTLLNGKADKTDTYTKTETNTLLGAKANATDVYTKSEVDTALSSKANASDVYTKSDVDDALATKADKSSIRVRTYNTVADFIADIPNLSYGTIIELFLVFSDAPVKGISGGIFAFRGLRTENIYEILGGMNCYNGSYDTTGSALQINVSTSEFTMFYVSDNASQTSTSFTPSTLSGRSFGFSDTA